MFNILERCGFGQNFLKIMKALYSAPLARIRLQGYYSEPFQIFKGTHQGCLLSPLVFTIAFETLSIAIRNHPDIHGVSCEPQIHKCALFADDLHFICHLPSNLSSEHMQLIAEIWGSLGPLCQYVQVSGIECVGRERTGFTLIGSF